MDRYRLKRRIWNGSRASRHNAGSGSGCRAWPSVRAGEIDLADMFTDKGEWISLERLKQLQAQTTNNHILLHALASAGLFMGEARQNPKGKLC
jgi:hypothetical protein